MNATLSDSRVDAILAEIPSPHHGGSAIAPEEYVRAGYAAALATAEQQLAEARRVIVELVACKNDKEAAYRAFPHSMNNVSWAEQSSAERRRKLEAEYERRKLPAWAAAQAFLAAHGATQGDKK